MALTRRTAIFGIIAAPAIVRASSLMAIKPIKPQPIFKHWRHSTPQEILDDLNRAIMTLRAQDPFFPPPNFHLTPEQRRRLLST